MGAIQLLVSREQFSVPPGGAFKIARARQQAFVLEAHQPLAERLFILDYAKSEKQILKIIKVDKLTLDFMLRRYSIIIKKSYKFISIIIILSLGVFIVYRSVFYSVSVNNKQSSPCLSDYIYISSQPDCEKFEEKMERLIKVDKVLQDRINSYYKEKKADKIAIFARDLVTRRFVGVNESESFYMASLLKTPLVIAYYKIAEVNPEKLDDKILYTGTPDLYIWQSIQPQERLIQGEYYSHKELIRRALVYSDNTAAEILYRRLPVNFLNDILQALSINFEKPNGEREELITAKSYANIFRILYNSSYLTRDFSNTILKILTETSYKEGAVKKLPGYVQVAHKFGERSSKSTIPTEPSFYQLHDCGIVYARGGEEPYTFCIMIEGRNFEVLQSIIQDLSLLLYEGIYEE